MLDRIMRRWLRHPLPSPLLNLLLMLRWHCRIHPWARIEHPLRLRLGKGVHIGRCKLLCRGPGAVVISLGAGAVMHDGVILDALDGFIHVGERTTLNPYCVLYGTGGLRIGNDCGIATQTVLVAANHTFDRTDVPIMAQPLSTAGIEVGDDVWLGAGCRVLDGTRLARGCVVAAGAVVTTSFPEGSVVAGVPARLIKTRSGFGT